MRSSRALVALAEDPERFIEPPEGSRQILTDSYCVVIGPQNRWAGVCSIRLPTPATDLQRALAEIDHLVSGAGQVLWNVARRRLRATSRIVCADAGCATPTHRWTPRAPPWC